MRGRAEMEPMPTIPRRVVTGHDAGGRSVFTADGPVPAAHDRAGRRAVLRAVGDRRDAGPDRRGPGRHRRAPTRRWTRSPVPPAPNGTKLRINEFPPGVVSPVHRTQSVDYGIVLDGEVVLVLDDSETVLRAGDVVVQRGTSHRWENRSDATARMAFILIDGAFTADLTLRWPDGSMTLHDPVAGWHMDYGLAGRTVVVTGAARGQGRPRRRSSSARGRG